MICPVCCADKATTFVLKAERDQCYCRGRIPVRKLQGRREAGETRETGLRMTERKQDKVEEDGFFLFFRGGVDLGKV